MQQSPATISARSKRLRRTRATNNVKRCLQEEDQLLQVALRRSELESNSSIILASVESATKFFASLDVVPTINPLIEEFNDPIELWQKLNYLGLTYGGVKVVPPCGWNPPFCLDVENLKFKAREQLVHKLASGNNAFKFPNTLWTFKDFAKHNDQFKSQYLKRNPVRNQRLHNGEKKECCETKSVIEWEVDYWRLVEAQTPPVTVLYGADIEVSELGSGFPLSPAYAATRSEKGEEIERPCGDSHRELRSKEEERDPLKPDPSGQETLPSSLSTEYYAKHPWNLLNLPEVNGSLLQSFPKIVPGVTCPWLYIGMLFSSFCWHTEDNYFAAVNYQHMGDEKVWYVIPPSQQPQMEKLMKEYLGHKKTEEVLHSLTVQLSPSLLVMNGIKVNRIVQRANEFVLLWPRTFHCGFNTGFNCNEACNIAPPVWLDWGHLAVNSYRYLRTLCIPYEQLIYLASCNCVNMKTEAVEKLIEALAEVIAEDYRKRVDAPSIIKQAPLIPSRYLLKFLPSLDTKQCKKRSTPIAVRRFTKDIASLRECFDSVCSKSIHLFNSNDVEFLFQFRSLASLPYLDCDNCKSPCYQSFVSCPHTREVLCLSCLNSHNSLECQCSSLTLIYRFPLRAQLRVLELLQQRVGIGLISRLKEQLENLVCWNDKNYQEISVKEENNLKKVAVNGDIKQMNNDFYKRKLPSKQCVESLETSRACPMQLGHVGPFVWLPSIASDCGVTNREAPKGAREERKRGRGRPRTALLPGKPMNYIPLDFNESSMNQPLTQRQFEMWIGLREGSSKIGALRLPSNNYDMNKFGVNDVVCRLASRHLMAGLEKELGDSEEDDSEEEDFEGEDFEGEKEQQQLQTKRKRRKINEDRTPPSLIATAQQPTKRRRRTELNGGGAADALTAMQKIKMNFNAEKAEECDGCDNDEENNDYLHERRDKVLINNNSMKKRIIGSDNGLIISKGSEGIVT